MSRDIDHAQKSLIVARISLLPQVNRSSPARTLCFMSKAGTLLSDARIPDC